MTLAKNALAVCLLFATTWLALPGRGSANPEQLDSLASRFVEYLAMEQPEQACAMLASSVQPELCQQLTELTALCSELFAEWSPDQGWSVLQQDQAWNLESKIATEHDTYILRLSFDSDSLISGFSLFLAEPNHENDYSLPPEIIEIPVMVDAGDGYPLDARLTLPQQGPILAGVVMIHGSGPQDMNEKIGPNRPLRDLAHALASQGIASLRYNKRTYSYAAELAASPELNKFDLEQEVFRDALAAVNLLRQTEGLDPDRVFLLGHSLGGGLLAEINRLGADVRGYIIMAGTSRPLWELSAEQNLLLAQELELAGETDAANAIRTMVTHELEKARQLAELSDEQALDPANQVFGINAWYLRDFAGLDPAALHLADALPLLILHAENDRQITEADFTIWQHKLAGHPNVFFAAFEGLNHLFGAPQGEQVPFAQLVSVEYAERTPVSSEVTDFIAEWIIANVQRQPVEPDSEADAQ